MQYLAILECLGRRMEQQLEEAGVDEAVVQGWCFEWSRLITAAGTASQNGISKVGSRMMFHLTLGMLYWADKEGKAK